MGQKKPRVQVNYRSGISMVFECDSFRIKGAGRSFEWDAAVPRPLLLGVDDIESVWEL